MVDIVIYEWDVEVNDENDEIAHHLFQTSYAACVAEAATHPNASIVIVRDAANGDRTWAYVTDGKLPERFEDAYQTPCTKVPARFHREVERYHAAVKR